MSAVIEGIIEKRFQGLLALLPEQRIQVIVNLINTIVRYATEEDQKERSLTKMLDKVSQNLDVVFFGFPTITDSLNALEKISEKSPNNKNKLYTLFISTYAKTLHPVIVKAFNDSTLAASEAVPASELCSELIGWTLFHYLNLFPNETAEDKTRRKDLIAILKAAPDYSEEQTFAHFKSQADTFFQTDAFLRGEVQLEIYQALFSSQIEKQYSASVRGKFHSIMNCQNATNIPRAIEGYFKAFPLHFDALCEPCVSFVSNWLFAVAQKDPQNTSQEIFSSTNYLASLFSKKPEKIIAVITNSLARLMYARQIEQKYDLIIAFSKIVPKEKQEELYQLLEKNYLKPLIKQFKKVCMSEDQSKDDKQSAYEKLEALSKAFSQHQKDLELTEQDLNELFMAVESAGNGNAMAEAMRRVDRLSDRLGDFSQFLSGGSSSSSSSATNGSASQRSIWDSNFKF